MILNFFSYFQKGLTNFYARLKELHVRELITLPPHPKERQEWGTSREGTSEVGSISYEEQYEIRVTNDTSVGVSDP